MLGRTVAVVCALSLLTVATPAIGTHEEPSEPQPVEVGLAEPSADDGLSLAATVHFNHQDCIDATAGVIGTDDHGMHRSATFTPGASTLVLTLDVLNLEEATCLPTEAADKPPRNAYVGHYNFKLIDVESGQDDVRSDCTYTGVPTLLFSNFSCDGPGTFWAGHEHVIEVTIEDATTLFGVTVPSEGAAELTAEQ